MNFKRIFWMIGLVLAISIPVLGKGKTVETIVVKGTETQVSARIKDGRTMMPLRRICEILKIHITGVEGDVVYLQKGENYVNIAANSMLILNDGGFFKSDVEAMKFEGVTYVPISAIGYMFGYDVIMDHNKLFITEKDNWSIPKADFMSSLFWHDSNFVLSIIDIVGLGSDYLNQSLYDRSPSSAREKAENVLELREALKIIYDELTTEIAKDLCKEAQKVVYNDYKNLMYVAQNEYGSIEMKYDGLYVKIDEFFKNRLKYATPIH